MASSAHQGNGSVLPTHTAASAPAWPSTSKPPPPNPRRRRCLCICVLVTLAFLIALAVTILILSLTVFRVRDPTTRLESTRLVGVAPRLTFPAISIQLNVTLLLTVAVHNPNAASFAYQSGHTDLTYRGSQVGSAEIDPGRIPSRGDGEVRLALTVQADRLASDLAQLLADVEAGSVPMEASTRIPGRVSILGGLFKRHAVAYSDCKFVFGVAEMKSRELCFVRHGESASIPGGQVWCGITSRGAVPSASASVSAVATQPHMLEALAFLLPPRPTRYGEVEDTILDKML